ncbi:MAG: hypothetical protein GXP55_13635 [Deltaproteobacteria bacterium]|nr:hypothetical protein [Deltaproteobacteria bacterium]
MSYNGPERRVHRMLRTRNTEYIMRASECIGVRDRRTGEPVPDHLARGLHLTGTLVFQNGGVRPTTDDAEVGACLCFEGEGLITSPVEAIERPARELLRSIEPGRSGFYRRAH